MAEGAPLLREYTLIAYRGFESLLLRQLEKSPPLWRRFYIHKSHASSAGAFLRALIRSSHKTLAGDGYHRRVFGLTR